MKKTLILLLLSFALATLAPASGKSKEFSGVLTVSFGKIKNPDGTWRSIKGMQLPFTAERIEATKLKHAKQHDHGPFVSSFTAPARLTMPLTPSAMLLAKIPARPMFASTVYNADAGSGYGVIEGSDPTSLDDIVMQGGSNLPWQNLTFGVDIANVHAFLIRWRCYTQYTEGFGHDVSAFSSEFADFGVIFTNAQNPGVGTWKITISVAAAGVTAPVDSIFMAQQFRSTQPNGEGPFDTSLRNVYNPLAPPSIGSSDDVFWFDWDAMNGIYAEDEIDNFGEGNFANMLRTITVSGTQESLVPFSYTIVKGVYQTGDVTDLWFSDDSWLKVGPSVFSSPGVAPIQVAVTGLSSTASINSLKFSAESAATNGNGTQVISLFNYLTNTYDVVDTRPTPLTDSLVEVIITNNPSKYVNPTNRNVKALMAYSPGPFISRTWAIRFDMAKWTITKP